MITGAQVLREVPVRYHKGFFDVEIIAVTVEKIEEDKGIMVVSYDADMFNNGSSSNYVVTLPIKG